MSPAAMPSTKNLEKSLQGVEDTLFTTLFAKARDAESPHPILGDVNARPLLDRCQVDLSRPTFRGADNEVGIKGIATRAKTYDDWVRAFSDRHAGQPVNIVHLGCGVDTRPLRIARAPNIHWLDVDLPAVAALRRQVIDPAPAGDYELLGCDARDPAWLERLPADRPTLLIAEGVLLYWTPEDGEAFLRRFVERFPSGGLCFDVTSKVFVQLSDHIAILQANGARWHWGIENPEAVEALHPAIRFVSEVNLPDPVTLGRTLQALFGDKFAQVKDEIEISSGNYKPITRILQYEFHK